MFNSAHIFSPNFGELKPKRINVKSIKTGDIITVFNPDDDSLTVYQRQFGREFTAKQLLSTYEYRQNTGLDWHEVELIVCNSNGGYSSRRIVTFPKTVSPYVKKQLPNHCLGDCRFR